MRVILLSIAFLFLAFSAQSQILKSAGVWYFLDVDSMTARPAVLPNGTEIAYVVGTRDIYCWNRTSSAWEICVPAVDSTVFATLHAVGDSIAAALGYVAANYFPLQGGTLTGTGGNGFVGFPVQSSTPATPSTGFSLYAGSTGNNISWMQPDGFFRRLVSPVTGTPRQYQFMARSYTLGDSADIANNVTSIAANYIATSNGTNLVARNLFDNNTYVGILNSKPWQFGQWTTAGRPSGTTGYTGFNTTLNYQEFYDGSTWFPTAFWAKSGTTLSWGSGSVLVGATSYSGTAPRFYVEQPNDNFVSEFRNTASVAFGPYSLMKMSRSTNTVGYGGVFSFDFQNSSSTFVNYARFGALIESNTAGSENGALAFYTTRTGATIQERLRIHSDGNVSIGNTTSASSLDVFRTTNALNMVRVGTSSDGNAAYARFRVQASSNASNYADFGKYSSGVSAYKIISPSDLLIYNGSIAGDFAFLNDNTSGKLKFSAGGSSTAQLTLASTGNLLLGTTTDVTGYLLNMVGTGAMSLPRGTVAQRPTIAASTTPFRYNTDSTALEYGESVGTWRQLSTRAYARSLVPTTLYTGNGVIPSGTTRTVNLGTGGAYLQYKATTDAKKTEYYIPTTDGLSDNYGYNSQTKTGGYYFSNSFASNGIYIKSRPYTFVDSKARQDVGIALSSIKMQASIFNTTTSVNKSTLILSADSVNTNTSALLNLKTENSTTYRSHWAGLSDGLYGDGQIERAIATSPSFIVQTSFYNSSTKFDWLRVDNLDTDTTSNRLSFYNNKYVFPNARPATGSGLKQNIVWTAGTPAFEYVKKDTTIYVTDADYNFAAAITSANILLKFNRIIIYSKLSASSTSDNQIFLHSASSDFLQCEIIIYSNDASADSDATSIDFTVNGAVDGAGGAVSSYGMSPGQRVNIRAVDDGGYKWFFN